MVKTALPLPISFLLLSVLLGHMAFLAQEPFDFTLGNS
jgi:hypothetical protein